MAINNAAARRLAMPAAGGIGHLPLADGSVKEVDRWIVGAWRFMLVAPSTAPVPGRAIDRRRAMIAAGGLSALPDPDTLVEEQDRWINRPSYRYFAVGLTSIGASVFKVNMAIALINPSSK